MDKLKMLEGLCSWFNYSLELKENGEIKIQYSPNSYQLSSDINSALISLLNDLNDANEGLPSEELIYQEEIKFITNLKKEVEQCAEILKSDEKLAENMDTCIGGLNKLEVGNTVSIVYDGSGDHHEDTRIPNINNTYTDILSTLTFDELLHFAIREGEWRIEDMEGDDPIEWTEEIKESIKFLEGYKIKCTCDNCNKEIKLLNIYDLQKCPLCGENTLPPCEKQIIVTEIEDIFSVNEFLDTGNNPQGDGEFDFKFNFKYKNSAEIDKYLVKYGSHFASCWVRRENNLFNLDNAEFNICFHGTTSEEHSFTEEQMTDMRNKVIKEIKDRNLGEIKNNEEVVAVENKLNSKFKIGKAIVEIVKNEEWYNLVKWEELNNLTTSMYEDVAEEVMFDVEQYLEVAKYLTGKEKDLSQISYEFIKPIIERNLEQNGYYFDEDSDIFRPKKALEELSNLLKSNGIMDYSVRHVDELDLDDEDEKHMKDNYLEEYLDVTTLPIGFDIFISKDLERYFIKGDNEFNTDGELISYIKAKTRIDCKETNNNLDLTYEGLNNQNEHVVVCNSPIVFTGNINGITYTLLADMLFCKRDDNETYIESMKCGNGLIEIKDFVSWVDLESRELFKVLEEIIPTVVKPKNYVQIDGEYYELNDLNDFSELKNELGDDELNNYDLREFLYNVDNEILKKIFKDCAYGTLMQAIEDVETAIECCDCDISLLESLLDDDNDISDINTNNFWIYYGDISDVAQIYIEEFYNYDNVLCDYINYYEMFTREISYDVIGDYVVVVV